MDHGHAQLQGRFWPTEQADDLLHAEDAPPAQTSTGRTVTIAVAGTPRPQGSMKAHPIGNKVALRYPAAVYQWRAQVQQAVAEANEPAFDGPVELRLGFNLLRPVGHYGTGRNVGTVRRAAPHYPAVMPDLDKLIRAVSDAITDAGLWRDDAQVCVVRAAKRYTDDRPGVLITVVEL
jgi:Holliday junction resolvase RusA-like endonuclease